MTKADFFFQNTVVMEKIKGRTIVSSALALEQGSDRISFSAEHKEH